MATTYPTSKQDLDGTRGAAADKLNSPNHVTHHNNEDDTIEALQDKVGIDSDATTSSHDYKLAGVTGSDKASSLAGTETLTNKTLTTPTLTTPKVDTINEENAAAGVTIDGTLIKDNKIGSAGNILSFPFQPAVRAYLGSDQLNLTDNTITKVLLDTENYDINGDFDKDTNNEFVVPTDGIYLVTAVLRWVSNSIVADKAYLLFIHVNGSVQSTTISHASLVTGLTLGITDVLKLTATDTVDLRARQDSGVNTVDIDGGSDRTWMTITKIH